MGTDLRSDDVDSTESLGISLFSGAAGLDLGVELAGIRSRVVAYVEREAYACEVLASRMDKDDLAPAPIWTDVTTFDGRPFRGVVDFITGGFPCQDISNAGKRVGIGGERSGLWKHYVRIIEEVQPRFIIAENVSALRSRGLDVVLADLAALGFHAEWGTLRAADVGATHHRDRMFVVAYRDGCGSEAVANPRCLGELWIQPKREQRGGNSTSTCSTCASLADDDGSRREGHGCADRVPAQEPWRAGYWAPPPDAPEWGEVVAKRPDLEPSVHRMADGLAHRVDRLRLTGNGVVPAQAAHAIRQLWGRLWRLT